MPERVRITCHGCKRKVDALVLKQYYVEKNINRATGISDNPIFPLFTRLKIENHRKGLLKGRCNRSGKVFRVKGRYETGDINDHKELGIK